MSQPEQAAKPQPSQYVKVIKDIFAGTCGGISVTLVGHPFDTVKIRLSTQPANNPMYSGMVDCFSKTVSQEGFFGLYKGVASPLIGQMFFRATLFGAMGSAKRFFGTDSQGNAKPLTYGDFYKSGFVAGFIAAFAEGPIDFYKTQVQVQNVRKKTIPNYKPEFTTMGQCFMKSFQLNGFKAPFQGIAPTIIRNAPANSIYLGSFEVFKDLEAKRRGIKTTELPGWFILGAAGTGGIMYWGIIFPVDVIKSSMQADTLNKATRTYKTVPQTFSKLWSEGGIRRFYKGFTPCIIRAAPANAAMLFTVDKVNTFLNNN